jgi:hypothetical protein
MWGCVGVREGGWRGRGRGVGRREREWGGLFGVGEVWGWEKVYGRNP